MYGESRTRPSSRLSTSSPATEKLLVKPAGLAELMVFYCEQAAGFCNDIGYQDDGYSDALLSMFEQALKAIAQLPISDRNALMARLD
jgi:hypothetical protein